RFSRPCGSKRADAPMAVAPVERGRCARLCGNARDQGGVPMTTFASTLLRICFAVAALVAAPAFAQERPASAGPVDPQLIEDLIAANRILAMQGVVDAMGHVSVRHNRDPNRYLMSLARAPELVTEADIMEYDLDSNPVRDPGRRQYSERYIHGEIYKLRPDVFAIVHAHTQSVVPFTVSTVKLRAIAHSGGFLAEGLPNFEIREAGGMTDMLVNNAALGRALAEKLGDKVAILMRGHGVA